jgi:hypothetical protein
MARGSKETAMLSQRVAGLFRFDSTSRSGVAGALTEDGSTFRVPLDRPPHGKRQPRPRGLRFVHRGRDRGRSGRGEPRMCAWPLHGLWGPCGLLRLPGVRLGRLGVRSPRMQRFERRRARRRGDRGRRDARRVDNGRRDARRGARRRLEPARRRRGRIGRYEHRRQLAWLGRRRRRCRRRFRGGGGRHDRWLAGLR